MRFQRPAGLFSSAQRPIARPKSLFNAGHVVKSPRLPNVCGVIAERAVIERFVHPSIEGDAAAQVTLKIKKEPQFALTVAHRKGWLACRGIQAAASAAFCSNSLPNPTQLT